jgi:hypothetical protein
MLKASFSSFEFYADGFVEFGVSKALFSSFEFYANKFLSLGYSRRYLPVLNFMPRRSPSTVTLVKPRRRSKNGDVVRCPMGW